MGERLQFFFLGASCSPEAPDLGLGGEQLRVLQLDGSPEGLVLEAGGSLEGAG